MRTTVELNDDLLRRAKERAAEEGTTLKSLLERALRREIETRGRMHRGYRLRWRTEEGKARPGVRLDDRKALFDLMDGRP